MGLIFQSASAQIGFAVRSISRKQQTSIDRACQRREVRRDLIPHRTTEFRNSGQIILMFRRQEGVSQLRLQRDECTQAMVGDGLRHTTNSQFQIVPLFIGKTKPKLRRYRRLLDDTWGIITADRFHIQRTVKATLFRARCSSLYRQFAQ